MLLTQQKFEKALLLHQQGHVDQALSICNKILEIEPNHFDSLYFLAISACQEGSFEKAVNLFNKAIAVNSTNPIFYANLAMALIELEKFDEAVNAYDNAIALDPNDANHYYNRGTVQQKLEQFESALISHNKAIELNANDANYYNNRGITFRALKKHQQALVNYDKAIHLDPNNANLYINRGVILFELNKTDLAVKHYNKAISLKPDCVSAYKNRGNALTEMKLYNLAIADYEKSLKLDPDYKFLLGEIFHTKTKICDWEDDFEKNKTDIVNQIRNNKIVAAPFPILSIVDSAQIHYLAAKLSIDQDYPEENENDIIPKLPNHKKIRIGYYSADFHNHATFYLMAELFELHDKSKFEITAFSFGPNVNDEARNRLSSSFDRFIDVSLHSDTEIVSLSRDLGIDIAVDLKGFTKDMRLKIFAKRAAPIQVSYLGYPGTLGAPYMDYIIADKTIIPEKYKKYYTEKIAYLPNSYQVNDSKRKVSDKIYTRQELDLPKDAFVFCCFNNNYKITPDVFDTWMRILTKVKDSVLWLLEDNEIASNNLKKEAQKRNVAPDRIIFAKRMDLADHLARHKSADLFLDTIPYNAHTTCSDSLWAGLPILTISGESFASRVSASLLNAINIPELITNTIEDYEAKAIELALNPNNLKGLKEKLEQNRPTTPLFNTELFTSHIEKAYKAMYDRYQDDLPPEDINI